jgi:hypothetical protein
MAKPIKIWSGSEWVDVAVSVPNLSSYATIAYVDSVAPTALDGGEPLDTGLIEGEQCL